MNDNDLTIIKFTNIADFDFTGDIGARYGGKNYFVPAHGSLMVPSFAADHFATHLARAIIMRKATVRVDTKDEKGLPLWTDASIDELKAKMLSDVYTESKEPTVSEEDKLAAKIADLNKGVKTMEAPEDIIPESGAVTYKDKQDVIEALKKNGIAHDPRLSKAALEALLN